MILNGLKSAIKYGKFYYTINFALSCPGFWSIFQAKRYRLATRKMPPKLEHFQAKHYRLATRKMPPNQSLAHVG
jgi:hypothetical protein